MRGISCISILWVVTVAWFISKARGDEKLAPALFVFGDSLVDPGNNNYLKFSVAKANYPHHGVDFPDHKPTGRFCNGKTAADILAEKLGLPLAPPYLKMVDEKNNNFATGVNFASAGGAILNTTKQDLGQVIDFSEQVNYYSKVHEEMVKQLGEPAIKELQAKAIYGIVFGSNDILDYYRFKTKTRETSQECVDKMLDGIQSQLKRLHEIGARKFVIIGVGPIGCVPSHRPKNKTRDCFAPENNMAADYNRGLIPVLDGLKAKLQGFHYTYLNTYDIFTDYIQNPAKYGFIEVKEACCGILHGRLPKVACLPISTLCANRSDHVFWDTHHPTEAAGRIFIDLVFDGSKYVHPMNIRDFVSI